MNKENSRSRGRARQHAGRVRYPERQRDADRPSLLLQTVNHSSRGPWWMKSGRSVLVLN